MGCGASSQTVRPVAVDVAPINVAAMSADERAALRAELDKFELIEKPAAAPAVAPRAGTALSRQLSRRLSSVSQTSVAGSRRASIKKKVDSPEEVRKEAKARMSVLARRGDATDFIFIRADKIREAPEDMTTLPTLQLLETWPGWTQRIPISLQGCMSGVFVDAVLTVSHRWEEPSAPDRAGAQYRAVRTALLAQRQIRWVWYDFWCMYQAVDGVDSRTDLQRLEFKHQLLSMNLLYMGTSVLILLDYEYLYRFWTNFEAWLAMQTAGTDGLQPSKDDTRYAIALLMTADDALRQKLVERWTREASWEATAGASHYNYVVDTLESSEIKVTNESDKRQQLYKVAEVQQLVISAKREELELEAEDRAEDKAAFNAKLASLRDAFDTVNDGSIADHVADDQKYNDDEDHDKWWSRVVGDDDRQVEVHNYLMCKGVELGFQYVDHRTTRRHPARPT